MRNELFNLWPDAACDPATSASGQLDQHLGCAVVHLHYSEPVQLLSVVFADGSAALYSTTSSSGSAGEALQSSTLEFRRWLCPAAIQ